MILQLSNGETKSVDSAATLICPIPGKTFNIDDPATWEDDRAWVFARVGTPIWTGKENEVATIVAIK